MCFKVCTFRLTGGLINKKKGHESALITLTRITQTGNV